MFQSGKIYAVFHVLVRGGVKRAQTYPLAATTWRDVNLHMSNFCGAMVIKSGSNEIKNLRKL